MGRARRTKIADNLLWERGWITDVERMTKGKRQKRQQYFVQERDLH